MQPLIAINFHLAVWLSIAGGILLFIEPDLFFNDPENIYGPLKNNLLIVMIYLVSAQLALWFLRYTRKTQRLEALLMGGTFLLVAGGLIFYAHMNALPLLDWLPPAMVYIGLSHCLYYWEGMKN